AIAAKHVTTTIPIVFVSVADPVADGLVISLARPGANLTGLSSISHELVGKRLELLKQAAVPVNRVAVLWQSGERDEPAQRERRQRAEVAARVMEIRLEVIEARGRADLDRAFSEIRRAQVGALDVLSGLVLFNERIRLVDFAARSRLPAVYFAKEFVEVG